MALDKLIFDTVSVFPLERILYKKADCDRTVLRRTTLREGSKTQEQKLEEPWTRTTAKQKRKYVMDPKNISIEQKLLKHYF
jgi:hypothetical protein